MACKFKVTFYFFEFGKMDKMVNFRALWPFFDVSNDVEDVSVREDFFLVECPGNFFGEVDDFKIVLINARTCNRDFVLF